MSTWVLGYGISCLVLSHVIGKYISEYKEE